MILQFVPPIKSLKTCRSFPMLALRNFQGLEFGTEHYESDGLWGERVPAPGYPVARAPRLSLCLCLCAGRRFSARPRPSSATPSTPWTHRMMIFSWECPYKIRNSPAMRRSTSTTGPPGSKGRQHHGPSTGYPPSPTRRRSGQTSQNSSTGSINQPLKDCQSQCDDAPIRLMPCNPFPVRTGNGGSSLLSILEYCSSY